MFAFLPMASDKKKADFLMSFDSIAKVSIDLIINEFMDLLC